LSEVFTVLLGGDNMQSVKLKKVYCTEKNAKILKRYPHPLRDWAETWCYVEGAEGFGRGIAKLFNALKIIRRTPYRPHNGLKKDKH
jgi:hypothetical protein